MNSGFVEVLLHVGGTQKGDATAQRFEFPLKDAHETGGATRSSSQTYALAYTGDHCSIATDKSHSGCSLRMWPCTVLHEAM